jgi:hypothetical protein
MRDRRDYLIAALGAALLFCLGLQVGHGVTPLPRAEAQDAPAGNHPTVDPQTPQDPTPSAPGGINIQTTPQTRPGEGRTSATASDSNSNNRFVAVTCPVGSGESVLFLLDSETEQLAVYRFRRDKGLEFLAGRKIDYDLRIAGYEDASKYSRDDMRRLFEKQRAREAADAVKDGKKEK